MSATNTGFVSFVGAGPGPGLITVRGLETLQKADCILYDDLLDEALLTAAPAQAEKIYVGKRRGAHSMPQEKTTALLIRKAKEGKRVVRLKGGDSFVFGRGGEEALGLQEAGIPFALVPGVTSAIAVPEYFGIPVTHRGLARSFTVVTGHTAADPEAAEENYAALARLEGTLVFLMGLHNLETICGNLIRHGKAPGTPASVLSKGFAQGAARYDGTLETITETAKEAETPAILIVGPVAAFHLEQSVEKKLERSFSGSVIGTDQFCRKFLSRCPAAVPYPLVEIVPVKDPLAAYLPADRNTFEGIEWLCFLSANAIRFFFEAVGDVRKLSSLRFACVGPATAAALREKGFIADFIPSRYDRKTLEAELPGQGAALLLGAAGPGKSERPGCFSSGPDSMAPFSSESESTGRSDSESGNTGCFSKKSEGTSRFRNVGFYETVPRVGSADIHTDYVVFASASGVRAFFANDGQLNGAIPVCIGKPTAAELAKQGVPGHIAPSASIESILETIRKLQFTCT